MEQKKHKHYDAIIAFANGSTIEWRDPKDANFDWEDIGNPGFYEEFEYRVKKKSVKKYLLLYKSVVHGYYYTHLNLYVKKEHAEIASKMYETEQSKFVKIIEIEEEENA